MDIFFFSRLYVYIYMYIYVCIYTYSNKHINPYIYINTYTYLFNFIYTYIFIGAAFQKGTRTHIGCKSEHFLVFQASFGVEIIQKQQVSIFNLSIRREFAMRVQKRPVLDLLRQLFLVPTPYL